MRSIRWRLTLGFALALTLTMVVFGATLYLVQHQASLRNSDQRLQQRLQLEAELSARYLDESHRVLGPVVTRLDTIPTLEPTIASYFESIQDYLVLVDHSGRPNKR